MKAKKYCSSPPARIVPPREPVVQWSYLWALLEDSGWRKILIGDVTDPVYVAMNYYAEIYVNVTAKDIWKLEAFFHGEIRCGEHYFRRYVCSVAVVCLCQVMCTWCCVYSYMVLLNAISLWYRVLTI